MNNLTKFIVLLYFITINVTASTYGESKSVEVSAGSHIVLYVVESDTQFELKTVADQKAKVIPPSKVGWSPGIGEYNEIIIGNCADDDPGDNATSQNFIYTPDGINGRLAADAFVAKIEGEIICSPGSGPGGGGNTAFDYSLDWKGVLVVEAEPLLVPVDEYLGVVSFIRDGAGSEAVDHAVHSVWTSDYNTNGGFYSMSTPVGELVTEEERTEEALQFKASTPGKYTLTASLEGSSTNGSESVEVTIIKVDSETVATVPADRARKTLGVGEEVTLTLKPTGLSPITWAKTGDGTLSATTGGSVTFTAHDRASTPTVTATYSGHDFTVNFTVVEPNGVVMEKAAGTGVWHVQNTGSVGFKGTPYIRPTGVSFINIEVREEAVAGVGTGYFAGDTGDMHPVGIWVGVGDGTEAKGSEVLGTDTIKTGVNNSPFSIGTFVWAIPWEFRVGSGTAKTFTTVNHDEEIDATGKMTISKGGHSETKNASDASSSF